MVKLLLALLGILFSAFSFSQEYKDGSYTWSGVTSKSISTETRPQNSSSIEHMENQGVLMDFSGGYQVGDSVADFTLFNLSGESLHLNSLLEKASVSGKYTVLFSGSNSCQKATEFFNSNNSSYIQVHKFMKQHIKDFNWAMIYSHEAHPIDTENCLTNCPPYTYAGPSGVGEFQHQTYNDRLEAIARWEGVQNGDIKIPEKINTYSSDSMEPTNEKTQSYSPFVLDIPVFADNPDNAVYNTYFKKPFGALVIDCSGQVVFQADWLGHWLIEGSGGITGIEFLTSLLNDDEELSCHEWVDFCNDESPDSDQDGLCDNWENQNQTNPTDICSPYGEDSDFDGLCNLEEKALNLDPFNPDSDDDYLSDSEEIILGTDPLDPDSDGDGKLDGNEISAGSDPLNAEDFSFSQESNSEFSFGMVNDYTNGKIKLELKKEDNYSVSLRTTDGKPVFSDYFSSKEYYMDPRDYSLGSYLISVQDSSGRIKTQKVHIE